MLDLMFVENRVKQRSNRNTTLIIAAANLKGCSMQCDGAKVSVILDIVYTTRVTGQGKWNFVIDPLNHNTVLVV